MRGLAGSRQGGWAVRRLGSVLGCVLMAWAVLAAPVAHAADALLTVVEGPALIVDGMRALTPVPGLRLPSATIIDTSDKTSLVRVEFPNGSTLDIGPDSKVMLMPPGLAGSGPKPPAFYLLQGWAKHSSAERAGGAGQLAAALEAQQVAGVTVGRVEADESALFVEGGSAQLQERQGKGGKPVMLALKGGQFYSRRGTDKGEVAPRPSAAFLQKLPRSFRDTVPPLAAQFKGKSVEAKPAALPGYAVLKPWLAAEPSIRREFPKRFAKLAQEPAFREALVKNLASHPEWEPVLFPPKPASAAR